MCVDRDLSIKETLLHFSTRAYKMSYGGGQQIGWHQQAYRHPDPVLVDPEERTKPVTNPETTLYTQGYVGFSRKDVHAYHLGSYDTNYPLADIEFQNWSKDDMPERGSHALYGVANVTGEIQGKLNQTFQLGGIVNVLNTGLDMVSKTDPIYTACRRPNESRPMDMKGRLCVTNARTMGNSNMRDDMLHNNIMRHDPAIALKSRYKIISKRGGLRRLRHEDVFPLGTAIDSARPGEYFRVLMPRPRPTPLWANKFARINKAKTHCFDLLYATKHMQPHNDE